MARGLFHPSPASQAQLDFAAVTPGSAAPSPGATSLSASFAGWLDAFFSAVHLVAALAALCNLRIGSFSQTVNYSRMSCVKVRERVGIQQVHLPAVAWRLPAACELSRSFYAVKVDSSSVKAPVCCRSKVRLS